MDQSSIILIVDDNPSGRKTLRALLLDQGYDLVYAENGLEALSKAELLSPDLILLDVMMPDLDGFEVCRQLRANSHLAEVPVIMVTALDDSASRLRAIEAGADDFVSKPFDRVELRARIKAITRLNRYRRLLLERTRRQEAEEKIRRHEQELTILKEVKRLQDRFISNASHELRTPLSTITLLSGNLDHLYDQLDELKRRQMIRDIRKQARFLNELIDNVLEISRIDSGLIAQEGQALNLAQLARDELERQYSLAQEKSQHMQLLADDEPVRVLGHKDQLQRVIRNLLHNAIKYTPSGGQITCECRANHAGAVAFAEWPGSANLPPGQWAALRVVDTGIGISPENLSHLFERFYRVEPQGHIPGTGLGLAIVKELVEWHEGRLGVSSRPGQGSTFAIYLPLEAGSHKG